MVDGAYQLTPGTWAEYGVRNLPSNTTYRLYIAVLERGTRGKVPGVWLEIGVTSTNSPGVLTRVFAEEGTNGIGRVLQATVQVEDTDPFVVPRRYLGKGDKRGKVGNFRPVTIVTNSVDELMNWKGRDITVHKLETHDEEARVTKIIAMPDWRCSSRISSRIWICTVTSSAVVGSSASSSRGPQASAIAIITRCRIPPESWCG